jgi:hypothetical protein
MIMIWSRSNFASSGKDAVFLFFLYPVCFNNACTDAWKRAPGVSCIFFSSSIHFSLVPFYVDNSERFF